MSTSVRRTGSSVASVVMSCGGGYGGESNGNRTARAVTSNVEAGVVTQSVSNVFDGLTRVESSNEATGVTSSVFGDLTAGSDGSRQWALTDLLGSVTGTADGTGQLTGLADYSDWGVVATSTDWDLTTGFGGETADATLGLDLYFRRAFDPFTGTWGQADPYRVLLGEPRSLNRFGFVENNPASLVDLAGFSADSASRWGGRAKSFFRSKSRAKKKKKRSWVTAVAEAVGRAFRKARRHVQTTVRAKGCNPTQSADRSVNGRATPLFAELSRPGAAGLDGRGRVTLRGSHLAAGVRTDTCASHVTKTCSRRLHTARSRRRFV